MYYLIPVIIMSSFPSRSNSTNPRSGNPPFVQRNPRPYAQSNNANGRSPPPSSSDYSQQTRSPPSPGSDSSPGAESNTTRVHINFTFSSPTVGSTVNPSPFSFGTPLGDTSGLFGLSGNRGAGINPMMNLGGFSIFGGRR
ncbi:hypothetical protein QBC46DRAFT_447646 [Diplogelasinospora grovesii]|uniref:Uncharacterized protein n=1 Tax=Diplogelasinospora grovesii TaxID=303347 RepID=A0AAN6S6X4_9PEZI|nr:hypothetical protein QBC46DRAFT_447646 [Diplogelasinospora grovesii]